MSNRAVKCSRGDSCSFVVRLSDRWPDGIPAEYTSARFQVRDVADDTTDALIAVDTDDGVTFDRPNSLISVFIGATKTEALPILTRAREAHAQLRIYNDLDPDDRVSIVIPRFVLLPDGVDDE